MDVGEIILGYLLLASKRKYQVVVSSKPKTLLFFINTGMAAFHQGNPQHESCYTSIAKSDHRFLEYDSLIYCGEAHSDQSISGPIEIKGMLTANDILKVQAAVNNSRAIVRGDKKLILSSLSI